MISRGKGPGREPLEPSWAGSASLPGNSPESANWKLPVVDVVHGDSDHLAHGRARVENSGCRNSSRSMSGSNCCLSSDRAKYKMQ